MTKRFFPALKAGATGYILKGAQPLQIIAAIDEIRAGGSPMSPSIARKVLREFQEPSIGVEFKEMISPLSNREMEILDMLYKGTTLRKLPKASTSAHILSIPISRRYMRSST